MKQKIDYIISEKKDERLIFRFYPRSSNCHSFNDEPPKSWEDVYKVYYSYAIIKQYKWDEQSDWESEIMFSESDDECSIIDEIGAACEYLSKGESVVTINNGTRSYSVNLLGEPFFPLGMGTRWAIDKETWDDEIVFYTFTLFKWNNVGYRFALTNKQIGLFGKYLLNCCEYMLEHGEPI